MARASDSSPSAVAPAEPRDDADEVLQVRAQLTAGLHQVLATIVKTEDIKAEGLGPARIPIWNREGDVNSAELSISSLLIGGPYNGRVPKDSPSRRRIFVCQPRERAARTTACATKILSTLARTCVSPAGDERRCPDADGLLISARVRNGDFDTGIRAALERLLTSPDFLFRIEADPEKRCPGNRLSSLRCRARLATVVLSLEQHSRR